MAQGLTIDSLVARARSLRGQAARLLIAGGPGVRERTCVALEDIVVSESWLRVTNAAGRPHILQIASDGLTKAEASLQRVNADAPRAPIALVGR